MCICDDENYVSNLVNNFLPLKYHSKEAHFTKTVKFFWINWTTQVCSLKKLESSIPKMQKPDK